MIIKSKKAVCALGLHIDEFSTHYDMRKQTTMAKIEQTIASNAGKKLPYKKLHR